MSLGLKESLSALVKAKYTSARAAGALTYAESYLAIVSIAGIPFQLRYCPSLAKKPTDQKTTDSKPKKKHFDPFESPDPQLLVCHVPEQAHPSHVVVLNKFPIIQNHFILATSSAKFLQSQFLDKDDLLRTYQCLTEWRGCEDNRPDQGRAFAFFNSGEHSGASQPHRHIQILPVEDMREGDSSNEWSLLLDEILDAPETTFGSTQVHVHASLPFAHFGQTLPAECDDQTLWSTYMDLYEATLAAVHHYRTLHPDDLPLHSTDNNASPISYNLAMTTNGMVICPRRREGETMKRADGSTLDFVALNGTLLGGTLLLRNEKLWKLLQKEPSRLESVLQAIGLDSKHSFI